MKNEFKKIIRHCGTVIIMRNKKFILVCGSLDIAVKINDESLKGEAHLGEFIRVKGLPLIIPRMFPKGNIENKVVLLEVVKKKGHIVRCQCWQESNI